MRTDPKIPTKEPICYAATVRDGGDCWDIECRFVDGQKFAAISVDRDFEGLAHDIAQFLNAEPE